ncbi:MAG: hypothetical protein PVG98_13720 [Chromatiales bacterium]
MPRRGELRIRSSRAPQGVDLSARLWNADPETISGWASAGAPGGALEASFDLGEGGDVVLELRDGRNDTASGDAYEIELAFTPVPELDEPDDAFGAAAPKPLGRTFRASILPLGDADWIAVEAPDQGELHLSVAEPPDGLGLAARVPGLVVRRGARRGAPSGPAYCRPAESGAGCSNMTGRSSRRLSSL